MNVKMKCGKHIIAAGIKLSSFLKGCIKKVKKKLNKLVNR